MAREKTMPGQPTMVRLADAERAALKLVAQRDSVTVSEVIRRAVLKDLREVARGERDE